MDAVEAQEYPDAIKNELYSRVMSFFTAEKFEKLQNAFVIVVGLGGVGSHAAHMLVRSGVTNIRVIDYDQVSLSSLNRHAVASMEDVGISKVEIMRRKLQKIVPWCNVDICREMFKYGLLLCIIVYSAHFYVVLCLHLHCLASLFSI